MKREEILYVRKLWQDFPARIFHRTTLEPALIFKPESSLFVYVVHRVKLPKATNLSTESLCFEVVQFNVDEVSEPVGFAFKPIIREDSIVRWTPHIVTVTSPAATKEAIESGGKKIVFSNEWIDLVWYSCGAEVLTDLAHLMGVYLGRDKDV